MEKSIDNEIAHTQVLHLKQHNATLTKQNQLLKQELQQLKKIHSNNQKELQVYKKAVLSNNMGDQVRGQVLEMQHQKIFQLQTQLQVLQNKYAKLLKSSGSIEQTDLAFKVKDYERRIKQREVEHQREVNQLRQKLVKSGVNEFVKTGVNDLSNSKRLITSPHGQVKKSSLGIGKFV